MHQEAELPPEDEDHVVDQQAVEYQHYDEYDQQQQHYDDQGHHYDQPDPAYEHHHGLVQFI